MWAIIYPNTQPIVLVLTYLIPWSFTFPTNSALWKAPYSLFRHADNIVVVGWLIAAVVVVGRLFIACFMCRLFPMSLTGRSPEWLNPELCSCLEIWAFLSRVLVGVVFLVLAILRSQESVSVGKLTASPTWWNLPEEALAGRDTTLPASYQLLSVAPF